MRWCNAVVFSLFLAPGAAGDPRCAAGRGGANDILGRTVAGGNIGTAAAKLRRANCALGVSTLKRSSVAPEVPPVGDTVKGYDADFAEVRERFAAQGAEVVGAGPEALAAALREDVVKWGRVVKAAGIKID